MSAADPRLPIGASAFDVLDRPPSELIERMESAYPTERELDRIRGLRVRGRPGVPYGRLPLTEFVGYLGKMLEEVVDGEYEIIDPRWLSGGASKIQMAFRLKRHDDAGETIEDLVVRMEPPESLNATSRLREYELMRALDGVIPVPQVSWVDPDGRWFPEPALVYSFVHGVTKPRTTTTGKISGLGTNFGPAWRDKLAPQFVEHLARIHTYQVPDDYLRSFDRPALGRTDAARWLLHRARRVWEEDRGEDFALMEVAANWLERNLPTLDHLSVVHGDFRSGNFLFDEDKGHVTAWLDWERAHLGDRHVDLAWATQPEFGHLSDTGEVMASGLMPVSEFYRRYEETSGLTVDPDRLAYFRILNSYQIIVTVMATAYRVVRLQRSHQDIVLSRVRAILPGMFDELTRVLEERL